MSIETHRISRRSAISATAVAAAATALDVAPAWAKPTRKPAKPKSKPKPKAKRVTYASSFSTVPIISGEAIFAARTVGEGPLVVMHPSLGRGASDYEPLALLLANHGYQAVAFDPRGIGQTTTPDSNLVGLTLADLAGDMLAVLQHFGSRAHVVGHAFGNRVTRMLGVLYPEVVNSITLLACGDGSGSPQAEIGVEEAGSGVTPLPQFRAAVAATFFAPGNDPSAWYLGWYPSGVVAQGQASSDTSSSEFVSGGTAPMLVIQGLDDIVAPPSEGAALKADYPDRVTLLNLEHAAHALLDEQPATIAAAMVPYLAAHPG